MRLFYDAWKPYVNRQPSADDLELSSNSFLLEIRQPLAGDLDWRNSWLSASAIIWRSSAR